MDEEAETASVDTAEPAEPAVDLPSALGTTGSFHFMQEDELENQADEVIEESGWVVTPDAPTVPEVEQPAEVEVVETVVEAEVNGHTVVQETTAVTTTTEVG